MRQSDLNFIVDLLAFTGFLMMTTSGVLMRYLLPPGSGYFSTIWGLDRHQWGGVHFWVSIGFFSVLALHLFLHWRWIVCVVSGGKQESSGYRAGLGLVGLLTVIALASAPLFSKIEKDLNRNPGSALSAHLYNDHLIKGSMSLNQLEQTTRVPASYIIETLELPEHTSRVQSLGQIKKHYGIEIKSIKEIVKNYKNKQELKAISIALPDSQ